ncbi:molybdenum cofactor guanylyltransferase MobA [Chelatococcus composti]|jgi:molybdopterin-guanine dinucleotide biosynthesis protein A, proteobacterial|uniref:Molybdenum cofactor guanylyltransferase n=1 Tax=Chelatococcus composti TaxID=1743235 RepID=A0A841K9X0_9HYPH|nr:molybdenum cofactor guanylyltransferase MobA [Chelatococcus composti]MBB6168242.1 molybdopterin-guanine dinucleotide biosynthesis protein A [Chelatococcus composti]MBS7736673.1 molybdenum cofactor guanylyltransferase MobA [Chelatococcus composti]PZN37804.1 MAG: molybdenum cofactor guanylyltransferase MobA [Pseudomonadota bacterium]GGG38548.1 molybdenum cofactor guanylyltransferase [Chelatococcus composti]
MGEAWPPTIGALLAGGLARRMGGGDKPLRLVGGRPILDHVVERMAPQCAGLVINANGDPARFASYGLPVVPDDVPGFAGPLAGVLAVLDHVARRRQAEWIVTVAADTPFLPPDLVARLHAAREEEGAMLACAASGGRTHPVIGLWPVSIREDLRRALVGEGERKIDRFTARFPLAVAEWPAEPFDVFFNANTPADIEVAESILAHARLS